MGGVRWTFLLKSIEKFKFYQIYILPSGGTLAPFSKIFDFRSQTPKNTFLHIFAQLKFSKIFGSRVPLCTPYTPMTPKIRKFRKFLVVPNNVQTFFLAFLGDIRKFFEKFRLTQKALFRQKWRFWGKSAKIEKFLLKTGYIEINRLKKYPAQIGI